MVYLGRRWNKSQKFLKNAGWWSFFMTSNLLALTIQFPNLKASCKSPFIFLLKQWMVMTFVVAVVFFFPDSFTISIFGNPVLLFLHMKYIPILLLSFQTEDCNLYSAHHAFLYYYLFIYLHLYRLSLWIICCFQNYNFENSILIMSLFWLKSFKYFPVTAETYSKFLILNYMNHCKLAFLDSSSSTIPSISWLYLCYNWQIVSILYSLISGEKILLN